MDCERVRDELRGGPEIESDPELEAHVEACPSCRALLADEALVGRALADIAPPELDVREMLGALQATVATERGLRARMRRLPTPARTAWVLGVAALVVAATAVGGLRPDWPAYPVERMVGALGAFASIGLGALALVVRPLHEAAIGAVRRVLVLSALVLPLLLSALPAAHRSHPASEVGPELLVPSIVACFLFGSAVTAAVFGASWLVERRSRLDPAITVLGVVGAALVGNLALQLHCPVTSPAHLVPGHGAIGLVIGGLAWLSSGRRGP